MFQTIHLNESGRNDLPTVFVSVNSQPSIRPDRDRMVDSVEERQVVVGIAVPPAPSQAESVPGKPVFQKLDFAGTEGGNPLDMVGEGLSITTDLRTN